MSKIGIVTLIPSISYYATHPQEFATIFLVARIITVLMGVASVYLVYKIGQKMFNDQVGILASALYAICPLLVIDSHYFTLDIPMNFCG